MTKGAVQGGGALS